MSKYQGPVFHKKLQTERQVQPTSPREVNRTQKETTGNKNIPFYKKHDHQPTKEPTESVKKSEKKTVSAYEDRTSTPYKLSHVPPSYFRSHKKPKQKKDLINYQLIFQKVAKTDDAFLLFEEYLSDFGKEQVENRTEVTTFIPKTEEQETFQMEPQEEQTQPSVIEEVTEKESVSALPEETPTESQSAVSETAETLPPEPVAEEPIQLKEIKKRGLSRSLAGMIQEEQDARLNKGRNIAHYFGESLKDAKPEPKPESQPATISELIARSRRNQPSNQLENLLRENEEPYSRKKLREEKVLIAPEVVEEAPIETEPTTLENEEVQETPEIPEQMDQAEPQAIEETQQTEVVETQEAESTEELEEQATAPIMEETSQPATITELLARVRANYSAEDFETLFGEEKTSPKAELVQEEEDTIEEPLESGRKEVNEDLAEPEFIEEVAEPSEVIQVKPVSEETIDAEIISTENPVVEDETLDVEEIEVTEEIEEVVVVKAEKLDEEEIAPVPEKKVYLPYQFPTLDLLQEPVVFETNAIDDWVLDQAEALNETLEAFNVEAQVVGWTIGPAITQFELQLGRGVKVNKITNLADDLKLSLAAKDIRIEAPIPGKSTVGVEVPNRKSRPVMISEVIGSEEFKNSTSPLTIALGVNLGGKKVVTTIDKMPHGLIAGATGSGKSVFINSLLVSLLYKATPNEVKLILIDPKAVELAPYNGLPHLLSPVISEPKAANEALKWAVIEMEERYQKLAAAGVRNLEGFNKKAEAHGDYALKLPYIVIIIDELADLMMVASNEVQDSIARITQKARAAGIHLIVATQRPSVDVVTGTIKNNIPTRVAFMVSSQIDSRTILDTGGAEKLLGRGDMLFQGNGSSRPIRIQGTYVEDEIDDIVDFVKEQQEANYLFQSESLLARAEKIEEKDELLDEVLPFIVDQGTVSASSLQRKFRIGFNRASNLIDALESKNLISENKGSRPRDVFLTRSDYEEKFL